uniref:Uncharacterized protein n=1 Tax=Magallana gigas TaxID=29159 RepID=A0A8W8NL33_MAGGI
MFIDIFNEYLNFGLKNNTFKVTSQAHVISPTLTVGEVVSLFNVTQFVFTYEGGPQAEEENLSTSRIRSAADKADVQAVNAFQILMAGGRIFPPKKNKQPLFHITVIILHITLSEVTRYKTYIDGKAKESEENRNSDHPVRTVDHRKGALFVKSKYSIIEKEVKEAGEMNPVLMKASMWRIHLKTTSEKPFFQ